MEHLLDDYIKRIANNDDEAFKLFYELTKNAIYSYAVSMLKNKSDADEIFQETYMSIYKNACNYKSQGKALQWSLTITKNLSLMYIRKKKPVLVEDCDLYFTNTSLAPEDKILLKTLLNELKDEERQIIILHSINGFKFKEIASLLGIPLATTLTKYHRAMKKLKDL